MCDVGLVSGAMASQEVSGASVLCYGEPGSVSVEH